MIKGFSEILRGAGGGFELNRFNLLLGGVSYCLGTLSFQGWSMYQGHDFDVTAFCLAFGGGFAALGVGGAGAVAIKDRNVASSKIIEQTGHVPTAPKEES